MKKRKYSFKKIFIIISATFLLGLVFAYSTRLIHFYRLENSKTSNGDAAAKYFNDLLESTINVSDSKGGLYINDKEYIYKYETNVNYLWYSGHLWRILKINEDKTMDIIMEESLAFIYPKYEENEYLSGYLEDFYAKLDSELLVPLTYCNDEIAELNNITCDKVNDSDITLLDISTYNKVGGSKSFLNNGSSYWLINQNTAGNYWYIDTEGALGVNSNAALDIRPIVRLKSEISLVSGEGTKEEPYVVKEQNSTLLADVNVGEYLTYNNQSWRIVAKNESSVTVKSLECLKENDECVVSKFGKNNIFASSTLYKYLNKSYYESIENNDYLVEDIFYIGTFSNHDYKNLLSKELKAYVGISKVSDYYINNDNNGYLITPDDVEMVYTINEDGNYYLNLPSIELNIYPVIHLDNTLNITDGEGTEFNPYILSR